MLSLRYNLVIVAFLALALPVLAQDADWQEFYPLEVGDTWEYEIARGGPTYQAVKLVGYQRRTVLGDTVLAGEAYRLVRVDSLSSEPGYAVLTEALCAVRVQEAAGTVEWVAVDIEGGGTCWAPESDYDLDLRAGSPDGNSLYINARLHEFEAVHTWGSEQNVRFVAARGFGVIQWSRYRWDYHIHGLTRFMMRAVYSVVGGEEYGHPIGSDAWRAFYPLTEGNVYEYENYSNCRPSGRCISYDRWDVGAEMTIDGEVYHAVRQRRFDEEFMLLSDRQCAIRIEGGREIIISIGEECDGSLPGWVDVRSNTWTIRLEDARLQKEFGWDRDNGSQRALVVEGVGIVSTSYRSSHGPGGGSSASTRLVYALVNGERYGSPVIPNINGSENGVSTQIEFGEAFPNPFRAAVDLTLLMNVSETVMLEVFDVLGRRVLSRDLGIQPTGPSQHRFTLGNTAAGVYLIRAATASGETATRRLVKLD